MEDWFSDIDSGLNTVQAYNGDAKSLYDQISGLGSKPTSQPEMPQNTAPLPVKKGLPFGLNLKDYKDPKTLFVYGLGVAIVVKVMR